MASARSQHMRSGAAAPGASPHSPKTQHPTQTHVEVLDQDVDPSEASHLEDNELTAAEMRMKLPQIAEASAEVKDSLPAQQHISFMSGAFKDNQVTLETPSLFPGSHQQPYFHIQDSTAAGSQDRLRESDAQLPNQDATAGCDASQKPA